MSAGYRARPRFPLAGADFRTWLRAAEAHGFAARFAASTLAASLAVRAQQPPNTYLVVELTAAALLSPQVLPVLTGANDLRAVVLELTSLTPDVDHRAVMRVLEPVRERGMLLAVKATGSGHVGLRELIELAPAFVNVDSELIAYVDQRPRHAATIGAIGGLAGAIDAWLVADGVRRSEELERLTELRVPLASGPLISVERDRMAGLSPQTRALLRAGEDIGPDNLTVLADPVRTQPVMPELATEVTVVVDAHRRPLEVVMPGPRQRTAAHPVMCVQRHDELRDVALRAASRAPHEQLAPLCLVDETGELTGLIRIEALLRALARS